MKSVFDVGYCVAGLKASSTIIGVSIFNSDWVSFKNCSLYNNSLSANSRFFLEIILIIQYPMATSAYPGQFVYKTDFIKLRRMVLKYELPQSILKYVKLQGATVGITGLNLITLYQDKRIKDAGIDPEIQQTVGNAQGSQGVAMPVTRNIGFNLNLRF